MRWSECQSSDIALVTSPGFRNRNVMIANMACISCSLVQSTLEHGFAPPPVCKHKQCSHLECGNCTSRKRTPRDTGSSNLIGRERLMSAVIGRYGSQSCYRWYRKKSPAKVSAFFSNHGVRNTPWICVGTSGVKVMVLHFQVQIAENVRHSVFTAQHLRLIKSRAFLMVRQSVFHLFGIYWAGKIRLEPGMQTQFTPI